MRIHKVVARFRDGRLVRGMTEDFEESGHRFTITDGPDGQQRIIVDKRLLKAVFFVKDCENCVRIAPKVVTIQFYLKFRMFFLNSLDNLIHDKGA